MAPEVEVEAPASWLKDKNIMITGCAAGIGQDAARSIATLRPKCMYLVARSESKAKAMQTEELAALGVKSEILIGDQGLVSGNKANACGENCALSSRLEEKLKSISSFVRYTLARRMLWCLCVCAPECTPSVSGCEFHVQIFMSAREPEQTLPLIGGRGGQTYRS